MLCSDFLSDLYLSRYDSLIWIGAVGCVHTMWLSELGTFAMFWGLKNPSITETDILWYDLREYICYFYCNACMFLSISALTLFDLHYELSTMHDPWLSHCKSSWSCMIMHELKTELITLVNWACQCPLCASSPILENIVRRVTSTGCTVRAKIIHLNMPCWMWVLWPSWGGRIVLS